MKTEKRGILKGIKVNISNEGVETYSIIMQFADGMVAYILNDYDVIEMDKVIPNLIEKYDLGVANMHTMFSYTDDEQKISFVCAIWNDDVFILKEILRGFEEERMNPILSLLSNVQPNANVINYGFTFSAENMNSLVATGNMPNANRLLPFVDIQDEYGHSSVWKANVRDIYLSKISLEDGMVVEYKNYFHNAGWNGPQSYGGYTAINASYVCEDDYDYDYNIFTDKRDVTKNLQWDRHTVINIEGDQSTKLDIVCHLKNLSKFRYVASAEQGFEPLMQDDIKNLLGIQYKITNKFTVAIQEILTRTEALKKLEQKNCVELCELASQKN